MSAITNQRTQTIHILLTHPSNFNSFGIYIEVADSHFTYTTIILEQPPKLHHYAGRFFP